MHMRMCPSPIHAACATATLVQERKIALKGQLRITERRVVDRDKFQFSELHGKLPVNQRDSALGKIVGRFWKSSPDMSALGGKLSTDSCCKNCRRTFPFQAPMTHEEEENTSQWNHCHAPRANQIPQRGVHTVVFASQRSYLRAICFLC